MPDIMDDPKRIASSRIASIAHHLSDTSDDTAAFIQSLRLYRQADQVAYITPMDPLRFLLRSAMVFTNKPAITHQGVTWTYRQLTERVLALTNALIDDYQVQMGDRVGLLCQNIPIFIEAQYAVPAAGAIVVPLNTRLAATELDYLIGHAGCNVLIVQQFFIDSQQVVIKQLLAKYPHLQFIIVADTPQQPHLDPYEQLLRSHTTSHRRLWKDLPLLNDENAVLSINYTSGSTGKPKGVMVTYRGAYLNALSMCLHTGINSSSVYLWTGPMFHCNGWGFIWGMIAAGGRQIMLNKVDYDVIWKIFKEEGVTHYHGAPTVQNEICNHPNATRLPTPVATFCGGAALSSTVIKRLLQLNIQPTHIYGLTETYGPAVISYMPWHLQNHCPNDQEGQVKLMARQGFNMTVNDELRVLDPDAQDVPSDGITVGEICLSGNGVMRGYYNNSQETAKAFRHGVFWSGDLAVRHPDGAIEIVDRSKDVIVSGGENISSLEVESVIVQLDQVSECAVVGGPDDKWGERPYAYVVLRTNQVLRPDQVLAHCRKHLAGYKCPSNVMIVDSIPKTSTGKIQKFILRNELWKDKQKKVQG
ncbi:uncharacterized protein BX664DRAFT_332137 [Halteromyces radiatus]|uniref:uncharacterized protein n=1 Tax=Halteromyces radiatus TaxID=101107 RepID=UPI00221E3C6E|nr:uncharacterized protein BX664DRAFT_332137 [Halteromyces radiatus]KAI8089086.1 hypothetical protein BX664DRAFT_332137 [Halteromyces radiatus]